MSAAPSGVFDLREEANWDTGQLVTAAFRWPRELDSRRLSDLATLIEPQQFIELGTQVVTPIGLDSVYGGIRRRTTSYEGPAYLVGGAEENLQPGDLLIATRSSAPALMVQAHMLGAAVSAAFSAFRFPSIEQAYWVWGVLNSTSGQAYLRGAMTDTLTSHRPRVGDLLVPWPDEVSQSGLTETLAALESETKRPTEDAAETWWSVADLREIEWRAALATPEPAQLLNGTSLEELGVVISAGRPFDRTAVLTTPTDGALPLVNGGVLAGRPITRWLVTDAKASIAEPGDILVAAVGDRAHARVLEQGAIIDSGVYRLRVPTGLPPERVTSYLNGQVGHGLRRLLLSGSVIPRVNLRDLKQLRVPDGSLDVGQTAGAVKPLAEQLELVLWTR